MTTEKTGAEKTETKKLNPIKALLMSLAIILVYSLLVATINHNHQTSEIRPKPSHYSIYEDAYDYYCGKVRQVPRTGFPWKIWGVTIPIVMGTVISLRSLYQRDWDNHKQQISMMRSAEKTVRKTITANANWRCPDWDVLDRTPRTTIRPAHFERALKQKRS